MVDHPCFTRPEDENCKIWRYMDFTKYVSILQTKCLFFCRSDLFEDPYEGATSHANEKLRDTIYEGNPLPEEVIKQLSQFTEWVRQWTYISCWHMNQYESAAMWKLYCTTNESIAIQTSYATLRKALPDKVFIGTVNYIDYEKDWLPEGNAFWPFVHKRKSFEHEHELRAIISDLPASDKSISVEKSNSQRGESVSIDPGELIESVHISPAAPAWFADLVINLTQKYGYSFGVSQSELSKTPVY